MAWLSELAGKAETLLNQIDQGAADAVQKAGVVSKSAKSKASTSQLQHQMQPSSSQSVKDYPTSSFRDHRSGYASSVSSLRSKPTAPRRTDPDETLLSFLNESGARDSSHSRRSSSSSLQSLPAPAAVVAAAVDAPPSSTDATSARQLGELRARETDMTRALHAKDSQLAVLRVRLQESDQMQRDLSSTLDAVKLERDRLLKNSLKASDSETDALQRRLQEVEQTLESERRNAQHTEAEYSRRMQAHTEESERQKKQVTLSERKVTEEKLQSQSVADQLRLAKYNLEANKLEFDEYKQKATRILQMKEQLIATLKQGSADGGDDDGGGAGGLAVELEELRAERDVLKEDLAQQQVHVYAARAELQELETQLAAEQRASLEQQRALQEQCQLFQQSASQYREQAELLKQEYQYVQDELRRQQLALQTKLHEKDSEIARLMNQSAVRSLTAPTDAQIEARARQLSENLIEKQTIIESLQTEKHALSLQLERMDRMYNEAESAAMRATSTSINMTGVDGVPTSRLPTLFRETPSDSSVARGVKRAYTGLDALSVRIGVFLRRYPMARLLVIFYMVMLHFWVMIVLLTYSPEVHPAGY